MNKKKLRIILSTTFSLPLVALNTSAFFHANSSSASTRYFDFPNSKYPVTVEYDKSTFSFENIFSDPNKTGPSYTRESFRMRIWEPKKWSEVLNKNDSSEIGKWQIMDEENKIEDIYDSRDERNINGAINTKVITNVKGFKITREFNSLDKLIDSIWWEKNDQYGYKKDFIETFNYYKNKERNSSNATISKITMSLEAKNLNARKVSYLNGSFNPDDEDEEESNDNIKYSNEGKLDWDKVTSYKITVELSRPRDIEHPFSKYKTDFNNLKSKLEAYSFNIETDTGGQLGTDESKQNGDKTNIEKLDEKLQEFNKQNSNSSKLRAEFEVTSPNTIDIYLKNEDGTFKEFVAKNVKVNITPSAEYKGRIARKNLEQRLVIKLGKWVDFQNGTTKLVDDKLEKDPSDKKQINNTGAERYGGRWIAHTPLKVNFTATSDETEVITINGKKIDVINYRFEEDLTDNRKDADDKEKVFNADIKDQSDKNAKNDSNSHAKNEYKIEITKYKDKAHKTVEYKYTKIIVIDSRSAQMDYKWFAWDPEKNRHQKELIEGFLTDEKGEVKKDKDGKPIPNAKYDPLIDKKTGTKKQLVWFDFKRGSTKSNLGLFANIDTNRYPEKDGHYVPNSDFADDVDSKKNYYKLTKAPYKTKTLFTPHSNEKDLDAGVIAEAVVLDGKGALKQLIGKNENATLFKLTSRGLYKISKSSTKRFLTLANETASDNYFSEEGIWLFTSNAKNSISNYKFVLINKDSSPYSQFLDNLPNFDSLKPLWETKQGKRFFEYLEATKELKHEQIKLLNYEDAMEYYKQYINDLWTGFEVNSPIAITPKFKKIPKQKRFLILHL